MITGLGPAMLRSGRVAFGLGVVENGYDETALVEAFLPDELEAGSGSSSGRRAPGWRSCPSRTSTS